MDKRGNNEELKKLYDIIIATLDYGILKYSDDQYKTNEFDFLGYFQDLKKETNTIYEKKQLTKLRQWHHDALEPYTYDPEFPKYIKEKTGYNVIPFKELKKRVDKVIKRKGILTEDEYRDVMEMISILNVENEPEKLDILQGLIDNVKW